MLTACAHEQSLVDENSLWAAGAVVENENLIVGHWRSLPREQNAYYLALNSGGNGTLTVTAKGGVTTGTPFQYKVVNSSLLTRGAIQKPQHEGVYHSAREIRLSAGLLIIKEETRVVFYERIDLK